jgi:Predicted DNA modification methylase
MRYFFVLGNNPALSAAEIIAVLGSEEEARVVSGNILILENPATDALKLIKRLGGTIKIGVINSEVNRHDNEKIKQAILNIIEEDLEEKGEGSKYCFGISHYGQSKLPVFPIGLTIKKTLKQNGVSCRLVTSKEKTLSSVVVEQNNLTRQGIEIVLIEEAGTMYVGRTEAVQDFKSLSFRDFGRPDRDDASGMIPPKLAQIMINLSCHCERNGMERSNPETVLLDPFCGSGTILMEAALMGIKNLIGSDISEKAISDTKNNLTWVAEKNPNLKSLLRQAQDGQFSNLQLSKISATEISQKIKLNYVDAIVTEPYLGPQRGKIDPMKTKLELEKLYSAALREFKKILKPDGRVVMIFPVRAEGQRPDFHFMNPNLDGWQIVNPLPENLQEKLHTTRRGTIVYGRPGQKVYREIVVLKKA